MSRRTVTLTVTLSPVVHGALSALARLRREDRAGQVIADLVAEDVNISIPGSWDRVCRALVREGFTANEPAAMADRARELFLEELTR